MRRTAMMARCIRISLLLAGCSIYRHRGSRDWTKPAASAGRESSAVAQPSDDEFHPQTCRLARCDKSPAVLPWDRVGCYQEKSWRETAATAQPGERTADRRDGRGQYRVPQSRSCTARAFWRRQIGRMRSEEHTSELQ